MILPPPKWDDLGRKNYRTEENKNVPGVGDTRDEYKAFERQGGAGACWAKSSAGLVFVAHDDLQYHPDKTAYKDRQVRQVVCVAPLKVPRM